MAVVDRAIDPAAVSRSETKTTTSSAQDGGCWDGMALADAAVPDNDETTSSLEISSTSGAMQQRQQSVRGEDCDCDKVELKQVKRTRGSRNRIESSGSSSASSTSSLSSAVVATSNNNSDANCNRLLPLDVEEEDLDDDGYGGPLSQQD